MMINKIKIARDNKVNFIFTDNILLIFYPIVFMFRYQITHMNN